MKNLVKSILAIAFFVVGSSQMNGQIYKNSAGLMIDFGDDATLVGPTLKHFFNQNSAGQVELLFGDGATVLQAMYSYNGGISGAAGLNWFVGIGPAFAFGDDNTDVAIRPMAGLEYKIGGVPLDLSLDWRPAFWLNEGGGSSVGRFGLGFKFTF